MQNYQKNLVASIPGCAANNRHQEAILYELQKLVTKDYTGSPSGKMPPKEYIAKWVEEKKFENYGWGEPELKEVF